MIEDPLRIQRVEKLERSNTVHGLWGGEGVSLTLVARPRDDKRRRFDKIEGPLKDEAIMCLTTLVL